MLEFEIDRYGKFARFTNIADLLELAALKGRRVSKAKVAGWLDNLDIGPTKDLFLDDTEFDHTEAAELVFDILREREELLGSRYPFTLEGNDFQCPSRTACPYLDVLGITVAHAHRVQTECQPADLFENIVTEALIAKGWKAARVGEGRVRFATTLAEAGKTIGLSTYPNAAVHSRAANDEGVDVVARLPMFEDQHNEHLVLLGQATIEKSTGWGKKASEVSTKRWKKYLGTELEPVRFFAVPHHIEHREFRRLLEGIDCLILDRLRLVQMLDTLPSNIRAVWRKVAREPVEVWQ